MNTYVAHLVFNSAQMESRTKASYITFTRVKSVLIFTFTINLATTKFANYIVCKLMPAIGNLDKVK